MRQALAMFGVAVVLTTGFPGAQGTKPAGGVSLADLSWVEAEPVLTPSSVVVIPLLTYHFYPEFVEYPGSASLTQNTARTMTVEVVRSVDVIRQNRQELFRKKEYRGSVHPVQLNDIRCVTPTVAIADGKWELRLADPPGMKPYARWCTLVLRNAGAAWLIEGWRYTVDPPPNSTPAPTILKKQAGPEADVIHSFGVPTMRVKQGPSPA